MKKIYLASKSPRRRELLSRVGIPFEVVERSCSIDNPPFDPNCPENYVIYLAEAKAKAAIAPEDGLILGCDTIVVQDGDLLEKPKTPGQAVTPSGPASRSLSARWISSNPISRRRRCFSVRCRQRRSTLTSVLASRWTRRGHTEFRRRALFLFARFAGTILTSSACRFSA